MKGRFYLKASLHINTSLSHPKISICDQAAKKGSYSHMWIYSLAVF